MKGFLLGWSKYCTEYFFLTLEIIIDLECLRIPESFNQVPCPFIKTLLTPRSSRFAPIIVTAMLLAVWHPGRWPIGRGKSESV
jgi:hypothetical protein